MKKRKLVKLLALTLCSSMVILPSAECILAADIPAAGSVENGTAGSSTPPEMPDGSAPPEMPSGSIPNGSTPPEMPDGSTPPDGAPGGMPGSGENSSVTLTGAYTADYANVTYDGTGKKALSSTNSDENTVLATNEKTYTLTNAVLEKTGDSTSSDNSNFYALNAILAATKGSTAYVSNSTLSSASEGSNAIFATGNNARIYAKDVVINTSGNSSRGLDATYGGAVVGSGLTITTKGSHCAAIATDRGGGSISVDGATLSTAGQGSPLIYSTGVIEVNDAAGEATGAQIIGMEGLNTIRIKNSSLVGSAKKASEPVANGVIIYQSTSGDSEAGTAKLEIADSTLKSYVTNGAMFYITNTDAEIVLSNTKLDFDTDSNTLLTVGGNDASNGWGKVGSNGGNVSLTAVGQVLSGDISCDGISKVALYLTEGSTYTGAVVNDTTTYTGNGGVDVSLSKGTTWVVTKNTALKSLHAANGSSIVDSEGKSVTVQDADGNIVVKGTGSITITAESYSTNDNTSSAGSISGFAIDRSGFNAYFADNSSGGNQAGTAVKKPAATKISSIKAAKKAVTLSWKKVSGSTGYVVYRSTSKNGTYKKIATVKATSYKDTTVKQGTRYYYKVQAYVKNAGTKVYGKKSTAKSIKTKK